MNSEKLLDSFNKHCMEQDNCEHCKYNKYNCINKSDILECGIWYGYNKAIDDFNNAIKEFVTKNGTIPNNFNSDFIADKLKDGATHDELKLINKNLINWQYVKNPNRINDVLIEHDDVNWEGLHSAEQIINIAWDGNHGCYIVFWRY